MDGRPGGRRPPLAIGTLTPNGDHFVGGHFEDLWAGLESPSTSPSPSAGIPGFGESEGVLKLRLSSHNFLHTVIPKMVFQESRSWFEAT